MVTTILADCPTCDEERECKILACDTCFEDFLEDGGKEEDWDDLACEHLRCLECGTDIT